MLIAISRLQDYRHAGVDVTWGAIIGIITAVFAYFQYYPPLTSARSQVPYPPRDFSYLVDDSHGGAEGGQYLRTGIRTRPNSEFGDGSRPLPMRQDEEGRGVERGNSQRRGRGGTEGGLGDSGFAAQSEQLTVTVTQG